jgi:hypothetical protein
MDIALQGNTTAPRPLDFSLATPLEAANKIQTGQTQLQMLNRQSTAQDMQLRNQLVANAAAHALDSDSWDTAMQAAVKQGAPEAAQYIGRYTPLLQQRLFESYSGAPPTPQGATPGTPGAPASGPSGAVGGPTDQYDRLYQNVPPDKMAASLQKLNMVNDALMTVRDQPSWDAAMRQLVASGIPQAQQFSGAYSPLRVQQLWQSIQPVRAYLQDRITANATGVPNPMVKNDVATVGDVSYSIDPYTGTAKPMTPSVKQYIGVDKTGNLTSAVFDPKTGAVTSAAPAANGSPFSTFADAMMKAENDTGNPGAKNPLSSATGNGQFLDSTWLQTIKSVNPPIIKGMTDQQILALRADPALSKEMTEQYAQENAAALSKDGLPVTTASLALAHRFGAEGAATIMKAAPDTLLSDILPAKVIKANPGLANVTAGQYAQGLTAQFGTTSLDTTAQGPGPGGDVHGEDYLKTLDPTMASLIKSYADGRQAFPSGFALKSPYFQNLIKMVSQYDPQFDAVNYQARASTRRDFTSGKSAQTINSLNTALGHLNMLDQAGDALSNSDIPAWNYVKNSLASATGQPAPGNFKAAAGLVAEELTRVYRQAGGSEADISRHMADLSASASPEQRRGALYEIAELLKSKLDAMGDQYNQGMGTAQDPLKLLNPHAQTAFQHLLDYGPEGVGIGKPAAPASAPPAVGPTSLSVDPRDAAALRANVNNPAAIAAIDRKYGDGTASQILRDQGIAMLRSKMVQ